MELDLIINKLNVKYYKSLKTCLAKNGTELSWLNDHINQLLKKLQDDKISETQTEKKKEYNNSSETDNHKQIFSDEDLYKKSWMKLKSIHKILKIKEFVNNLKINSEKDRYDLREQLVELIKSKVLTKKEKVKYDEVNGIIISLTNLQYQNGRYFYANE
jgi:hypothetical protein